MASSADARPLIFTPDHLGTMQGDERMTIVFIGEGGAQNGRMAECLNAAAKEVRCLCACLRGR